MEEAGDEDNLGLLPTSADPRLYAVGCKPGSEREAAVLIMKKYFDCLGTTEEFQIFSVNAIDKTEGYIYIEAFNNKHVYLAIQGIGIVNSRKVAIVNFADRTQIFENDPTKNIEVILIKDLLIYLGQTRSMGSYQERTLRRRFSPG